MSDRFYVFSTAGDGAFVTPLLRAEGAPTTLYTVAPEARDVLRGYVPRQTVADVPKGAVILFDDVGHGRLGSFFRGRHHPVIGGNPIDRAWEIDRLHGAKMAERAGITVPETQSFTTIRQAIRFLEGQEGEWFVKPSGNPLASCALTQSGEAAKLVRRLYAVDRKGAQDFPALILQKAVEGLEIDCFDPETEVLTHAGWKGVSTLSLSDLVLTRDPTTAELLYVHPARVIARKHKGEMIAYRSQMTDFCVTPNHRMLVRTHADAVHHRPPRFLTADECAARFEVTYPKTGVWRGEEQAEFVLPAMNLRMGWRGDELRAAATIPMDAWLTFMGWYLSEGSTTKSAYTVIITQDKHRAAVEQCLSGLPFHWNRNRNNYRITSKQLYSYLEPFGHARDKYVPQYIKDASPRQIRLFLAAYLLGDGHTPKDGRSCRFYATISPRMADDLQELILKAGDSSTLTVQPPPYPRKPRQQRETCYVIAQRTNGHDGTLLRENYRRVPYDGWVYCVSVPPHRTLYIRRRGRTMWTGNCDGWFDGEAFVHPFFSTLEDKRLMDGDRGPRTGCSQNVLWPWHLGARLPEDTVALVTPFLQEAGYVGNVAVNLILDSAGEPHFLEWSMRTGFDALQAFVALLDTNNWPLSEQLAAFARGELAEWYLRPDVSLSLTTRVSVPPYPTHDLKALAEAKGSPLDEWLDGRHPRLFPYDVMKGEDGKPALAGSSGMVCTVGATGTDMADCRSRVRELAESLDVDDAQWRTDLVPRYETAMATLRDLGYMPARAEVADASDKTRAAG